MHRMLFLGSMSGSSSSEGGERLWSIYLLWCSPGREGLVCARGVNTQAVNAVTFPNDVGGVIESLALFILQKLFRILYSYSYVLQYHGTFLQTVISWSTRKVRYSVFLSTTLNAYGLYTVPAADARTYQYHSSTYSSTSILSHDMVCTWYGYTDICCCRSYQTSMVSVVMFLHTSTLISVLSIRIILRIYQVCEPRWCASTCRDVVVAAAATAAAPTPFLPSTLPSTLPSPPTP